MLDTDMPHRIEKVSNGVLDMIVDAGAPCGFGAATAREMDLYNVKINHTSGVEKLRDVSLGMRRYIMAQDAPKADGAEVKAAEPTEPVEEQPPVPAASEESATEDSAAPSEEPSTPPVPEKVEEQSSSDDAKETDAPKKADA
ncbi:hypothetical protein ONZ45_g19180 [Pleurotus djamor]|nr:hypothetical protein ONZ45_g19180 [Pleurotus djamor]